MRDGLLDAPTNEAPDNLHDLADILHAYKQQIDSTKAAAVAHPTPAAGLLAGTLRPPSVTGVSATTAPSTAGLGAVPPPFAAGVGAPPVKRTYAKAFPHIYEQPPAPPAAPPRRVFLVGRKKKAFQEVTRLHDAAKETAMRHPNFWGYVVGREGGLSGREIDSHPPSLP